MVAILNVSENFVRSKLGQFYQTLRPLCVLVLECTLFISSIIKVISVKQLRKSISATYYQQKSYDPQRLKCLTGSNQCLTNVFKIYIILTEI